MTDQSTLFKADQAVENQAPAVADQPTNGTDSLTQDVALLKKRFEDSQAFIEKLKQENSEMREEVQKSIKATEILNKLSSKSEDEATGQPAQAALDIDQISSLINDSVKRTLSSEAEAKVAKANTQEVLGALTSKFGSKAEEIYNQKAGELGITPLELDNLVKRSSKAALQLFGLQQQSVGVGATSSSVNTATFSNNNPNAGPSAGTFAYYEKIRKENPTQYYSQSVQVQMHKDAMKAKAEGKSFY